jgi:nucleotide-binding universal stress UspA family protein
VVRQASGGGRIVVGTDGSVASATAVRWAAEEAELRGVRLLVVHVRDTRAVQPALYAPLHAGQGSPDLAAQESGMEAMVREATGPGTGATVELELVDGLPSRVLIERATGAVMLVLGSTRISSPAGTRVDKPRAPLGPVARDCLRAAPCPVMIVSARSVPPEAEPVPAGVSDRLPGSWAASTGHSRRESHAPGGRADDASCGGAAENQGADGIGGVATGCDSVDEEPPFPGRG